MELANTALEIQTLGRFGISVDGKSVATNWPDDSLKGLFCSLLSPLDLYFTWDRVCRAMWGVPVTRTKRRYLEEFFIRPLNGFLIKELGFTPVITGQEGIRISQEHVHLDAREFYNDAVEGLRSLSQGNHDAALEKFNRATALYAGSYLPGLSGKIITNTRNELESLYQSMIMYDVRQTGSTPCTSSRDIRD